jgi:hypothetical protein
MACNFSLVWKKNITFASKHKGIIGGDYKKTSVQLEKYSWNEKNKIRKTNKLMKFISSNVYSTLPYIYIKQPLLYQFVYPN